MNQKYAVSALLLLPLAATAAVGLIVRERKGTETSSMQLSPRVDPQEAVPSPPHDKAVVLRKPDTNGSKASDAPQNAALSTDQGPDPAQTRSRFDFFFEKDPLDKAAARDYSRKIMSRLDAVLASDSSVKSLECRATMCRLETVHQSEAGFRAFMDGAFKNFDTKLTTGGSYTGGKGEDGPGRIVFVTYLAKDGADLPDISAM